MKKDRIVPIEDRIVPIARGLGESKLDPGRIQAQSSAYKPRCGKDNCRPTTNDAFFACSCTKTNTRQAAAYIWKHNPGPVWPRNGGPAHPML